MGFIPTTSKVGLPDLVIPPLRTDLVTTVLSALASSVPDVSSSSDLVIPKSWFQNPDLGNSSCLSLGPHNGGKATPTKSNPSVHVQLWLIGNIRSVGGPDLLRATLCWESQITGRAPSISDRKGPGWVGLRKLDLMGSKILSFEPVGRMIADVNGRLRSANAKIYTADTGRLNRGLTGALIIQTNRIGD